MWDAFLKLRELLSPSERRRALVLMGLILLLGIVESTSVASVMPFVAVLADPGVVNSNEYLAAAYHWLGFQTTSQFLIFLGVAFFVLMIGTVAITALASWATLRFSSRRNYAMSIRLFDTYLHRPYEWFLNRNSADIGNAILAEVEQVVAGALMPMMQFATGLVVATAMIGLLLVADPVLALAVSAVLGGSYGAIYWFARRFLSRIGGERVAAFRERFRASSEAFGGVKDVKVLGLERVFVNRFDKPARRLVHLHVVGDLIGQMPRYVLQVLAYGVVLAIVWYQMAARNDLAQALPVIALYALAGQRLMPALQKIYQAAARIRYAKPALNSLYDDLLGAPTMLVDRAGWGPAVAPLGLQDRLTLKNVCYRYPGRAAPTLEDVSLTIGAHASVGLVGQTGAGKTTLVDVILGLLEPQAGELIVDGTTISELNRRAWQGCIGYVPQHIFVADDTVAANIAFGVAPENIDMAAVESASRVANLHDFVTSELEHGYATVVGERGIRLSGGQRQRIGIARALYRDPDLLIMDEGTSALDNITERAVIDAVNNLARAKTIILIAHRLSTVRDCDQIFVLDRGRLTASGTYDELVVKNPSFRAMAESLP